MKSMRMGTAGVVLLCLVLCGVLLGAARAHSCIHDHIASKYSQKEVRLVSQNYHVHERAEGSFSPIRIYADYHNLTLTDTQKVRYLKQVLLPAALDWINSALSVMPVRGNLVLHAQCRRYYTNPYRCIEYYYPTQCGEAIVPEGHLNQTGRGVPNTDFILYVTSEPTTGDTLAYAVSCQFDQNDRPIAGNANFGPQHIIPAAPGTYLFDYQLNTVIHELFHALGFSQNSFDKFRDSSGRRYTATKTFNERGHTVTKIISPRAVAAASKYFNCDKLNGVELEDAGGSGTAGSHWEKRIFNQEFMTGVSLQGDYGAKTAVSLALMEDSGWYKANYSAGENLYWGKGEGCAFALDSCMQRGDPPVTQYPDYFCSEPNKQYCGVGRLTKGLCGIARYQTSLPPYESYFRDPTEGGSMQTMDFCPYYGAFYQANSDKTSHCEFADNQPDINYWGESYGPSARCFVSSLQDTSFSRYLVNGGSTCHQVNCGDQLTVKVGKNYVKCPLNGGSVQISGFSGVLVCPPYNTICPLH